MSHSRNRRAGLALGLALLASACRNSSESVPGALPVVPNAAGVNGCSGPDQVFTPPQAPTAVPLSTLVVGPASQITAAGSGEMLYATGAGGQIVAIDVSGPAPVEAELLAAGPGPGTVTDLLAAAGIATPPSLSGIAVLDADRLVVVEQTSNTLLAVQRLAPFTVAFFAGQPNETPGFADGLATGGALLARFSFGIPSQVCPTGDVPARVFVCDPGNHAIRVVQADPLGVYAVSTIAGNGLPFYSDGDLDSAFLDTPSGVSAACSGALLASERGGGGYGHRIRQLEIGQVSPFGGYFGSAITLAGDGVAATTGGVGTLAQVDAPVSPLVSSTGEVLWIDSGTGVLRRMRIDKTVDCPLDVDCTQAIASTVFPPGHEFSLTETPGGVLFVLDATSGVLYRVSP